MPGLRGSKPVIRARTVRKGLQARWFEFMHNRIKQGFIALGRVMIQLAGTGL